MAGWFMGGEGEVRETVSGQFPKAAMRQWGNSPEAGALARKEGAGVEAWRRACRDPGRQGPKIVDRM
jgi:hypothetical protein